MMAGLSAKKRATVLLDLRKAREAMLKVCRDLDDGNNIEAQQHIMRIVEQIEMLITAMNRF